MTLLILGLLLAPKIPPDLVEIYRAANRAWAPYVAPVDEVKWCEEDCPEVMQEKELLGLCRPRPEGITIYLRYSGTYGRALGFSREEGLRLTMIHELGHALGLDDSNVPGSIMNPDWRQPVALGPTEGDFQALAKINTHYPHPVFDKSPR